MKSKQNREEKVLDLTQRMSNSNNKENFSYAINLCSKLLKNRLNKELEKEGITAVQFSILRDVEIHMDLGKEDERTPVRIAYRMDMDKPTISGIINRLVAKGYLEKFENKEDKRSYLVDLTEMAKSKMASFYEINMDITDLAIEDIEVEKLRVFGEVLLDIMVNLR